MQFDSNRAWNDALAAVTANREVLLALGGVFFLLPTLLSTVFLTDVQAQILEALQKPQLVNRVIADNIGLLAGFGIGGTLVQLLGYLAVTALISERGRPTVGESIGWGLRAVPSLFAVLVIGFLGLMLATTVFSAVVVGLFAVLGAPGAGSVLAVVLLMLGLAYVSVKLSLVVPVIVNEGLAGPVLAMARSWKLTKGNSLRLFGFYTLLSLGYFVIALMSTFLVVGPVMLVLGQGKVAVLVMGLVSGAIGAAASVLFAAVLSKAHSQLAGPSAGVQADLFE
ncbi:lipoyltransferase [Novosphingobium resinovorum]|uniref:lipoyltransferase n=1 Tax=Novosphingobium resinovorum TaxID=158500 RepID=UPI002ED3206F|nr:lipoyltransferase [Novosphingobium resinovorum]